LLLSSLLMSSVIMCCKHLFFAQHRCVTHLYCFFAMQRQRY
jgi:hypothetical protein